MPLIMEGGGEDGAAQPQPAAAAIGGASSSASGAAGGGGFDLTTASTLFWKPVPVLLRQAEREDQHEELTFRILSGTARSNHNMRILRIHISSESDLFFLHTLEVSEEDFQTLKNEQGILVDFASFPGKVITLLDRCIHSLPTDAPRFQAVLTVRGAESVFRIMEINDFKQLPHIALAFRPGNDAAVKHFLAFRLLEVKGDASGLSTSLNGTQGERDSLQQQLRITQQQLSALQEQYDKHVMEVQAEAKTQRASSQEERLKEKSEMKDAFAREMQDMQRRHVEQIDAVNARCAELETANRKLRDIKYELDTKVSELSHRSGTAEGRSRSLEDEAARLRAANQQLSLERHEREAAAGEARARAVLLEEKASAQVELMEQQKSRIRDLETSVRQLEGRWTDAREVSAGHEQRAKDAQAEIVKGNQIIEKLSNDIKLLKEKIKRKQAIIVRQEEELQAREQALASDEREMRSLTSALEATRGEALDLRSANADFKSKLEDSKNQLQSNEQMIRWLNQQVTEAQLGSIGTVPGSRYSFRPALPGPGPGAIQGSGPPHHHHPPHSAALKPFTTPTSASSPARVASASTTPGPPAFSAGSATSRFAEYSPPHYGSPGVKPEEPTRPAAVAAAVNANSLRFPGR